MYSELTPHVQTIRVSKTQGYDIVILQAGRQGGKYGFREVGGRMLVLWQCAMLVLLHDVIEEDKKIRTF